MASKPGRLIRYIHDRLLPKHKKETTYSSEEISQTSLRNFQQDTAYQEMISPGEVPSPGTDGLILLFQLEEFNQEEENSVQCPCNDYFPPLWLVPWFDFTHFNYNNYKIVSNKLLNSLNDDSLPINSCIDFNKSNKKEGKRKETPRKRKLCSSLFSRIKGKGFNS
ncbi:uncharacterized protein LOC143225834 isoform X2 [Tachypleus tridentatus]|uniref:uncharacterized protein LOC143225834 isoform X2 n=1 Tax=Tachypleus tridentatus TaxID=6853 RepID=UPI003FD09CEB